MRAVQEKTRDYRFDNLKGILIFLVVLGHVLNHFKSDQTPLVTYWYALIYSFHMPAFIFISGFFSKNMGGETTQHYENKVISTVLLPFGVFHTLMWALTEHSLAMYFTPAWTMWYLLSLFFWKISVPMLSRLKHVIWVSILFALLFGFTEAGELMAVSKTIAFFPYFFAGYLMNDEKIAKIRSYNKMVPVALMIIIFTAVVVFVASGLKICRVFTMKESYESSELSGLLGVALRSFSLLAGFVLTFCLIAIVPDKQTIISYLGRNTMTVYLGHSFTIVFFQKMLTSIGINVVTNDLILIPFALVLSTGICVAFGNNLVSRKYAQVMNKISGLFIY